MQTVFQADLHDDLRRESGQQMQVGNGETLRVNQGFQVAKGALPWIVIAAIGAVYLTGISAGHCFADDDFGAYVMHAANLVEGRPYTAIHYIPNPKAPWLAPSNGYPPVYPLLLAPVYRAWGLNLRALKVVTILCFVAFLLIFAMMIRQWLSPLMSSCALLIIGFNPVFWHHREVLLSEFPYLMFSFAALLAIQRVYKNLAAKELRIGMALLVSILFYLTYGTRTIGIALLPALALADVIRFKRPSRFLLSVLLMTSILIVAQALFLASPKGYVDALRLSPRMAVTNATFYGKTLSSVWQNGFSKTLQISFALVFTALAGIRFARKFWTDRSESEFYILSYLAILISWSAQIGLRGLLPVLPLYFANGLQELARWAKAWGRKSQISLAISMLLLVSVTYYGPLCLDSSKQHEPNVQDPMAQELFFSLKAGTAPSEVLIFPKPRSLALFTGRAVASLAPDEAPEDSYEFMKSIHAEILVKPRWSPASWQALIDSQKGQPEEIFHNSEYQAFRVKVDDDPSARRQPRD